MRLPPSCSSRQPAPRGTLGWVGGSPKQAHCASMVDDGGRVVAHQPSPAMEGSSEDGPTSTVT